MYYEFSMYYSNGSVSITTIEQQEFSDQMSYCRKMVSNGSLERYDYESIVEMY